MKQKTKKQNKKQKQKMIKIRNITDKIENNQEITNKKKKN